MSYADMPSTTAEFQSVGLHRPLRSKAAGRVGLQIASSIDNEPKARSQNECLFRLVPVISLANVRLNGWLIGSSGVL